MLKAIDSQAARTADLLAASRPHSFTWYFLAAVLAWCALPLSPSSVDSDFWGHVQYGRDTWQFGVPETATYTYTAPTQRWINHENLAELIFAAAADGPGVWVLLVGKCLIGVAILWVAARGALRQHVSPLTIGLCCVVASVNLSFYWGVRPHVFTFIYFAILIAWTDWCFAGWAGAWHLPWPGSRWRDRASCLGQSTSPVQPASGGQPEGHEQPQADRPTLDARRLHGLWILPGLMLLWTNTHGGFLAGLAVLEVVLVCRSLELLVRGGRSQLRNVALLAVIGLASLLATLVNPYGIELHRWLLAALSVPRPEIQEWHPPQLFTLEATRLWWLLGLFGVALVGSRRARDFTQLAVIAVVLHQALKHQRHLPFVALLFLFWAPVHLQSVGQSVGQWIVREQRRLRRTSQQLSSDVAGTIRSAHESQAQLSKAAVVRGVCVVLAVIFAVQTLPRLREVPVARSQYPVSAVQYMADQGLGGRVVVAGHWAQYVLGVLGARTAEESGVQVAFDGRFRTCYPQQVVDLHFDFFSGPGGPKQRYRSPQSPPADPKRILHFGDPQWVLVGNHHEHARQVLEQHQNEWVLVYRDQLAQLWGRRSAVDDANKPTFVAPSRRQLEPVAQNGTVPWPAAPRRSSPRLLAQQAAWR